MIAIYIVVKVLTSLRGCAFITLILGCLPACLFCYPCSLPPLLTTSWHVCTAMLDGRPQNTLQLLIENTWLFVHYTSYIFMPHVDNDHVSFHIVFIMCYINPPHKCDKDPVDWPLFSFYTSWTCGEGRPHQQV